MRRLPAAGSSSPSGHGGDAARNGIRAVIAAPSSGCQRAPAASIAPATALTARGPAATSPSVPSRRPAPSSASQRRQPAAASSASAHSRGWPCATLKMRPRPADCSAPIPARSSTTTRVPRRASSYAAASPQIPAPTTITSQSLPIPP